HLGTGKEGAGGPSLSRLRAVLQLEMAGAGPCRGAIPDAAGGLCRRLPARIARLVRGRLRRSPRRSNQTHPPLIAPAPRSGVFFLPPGSLIVGGLVAADAAATIPPTWLAAREPLHSVVSG